MFSVYFPRELKIEMNFHLPKATRCQEVWWWVRTGFPARTGVALGGCVDLGCAWDLVVSATYMGECVGCAPPPKSQGDQTLGSGAFAAELVPAVWVGGVQFPSYRWGVLKAGFVSSALLHSLRAADSFSIRVARWRLI